MAWSFGKLAAWFQQVFEPEPEEGEGIPVVRDRSRPPEPAPDVPTLAEVASSAVAASYGPPVRSWPGQASEIASAAAVERVDLRVAADPGHYVYVTHGLLRWRHPYELVLRVAATAPSAEAAPSWPVDVLVGLGEAVRVRNRSLQLGERLRPPPVASAPYPGILVVPDPVLEWIEGEHGLAFLQAVPLSEERLAELDAAPVGAPNPPLAAWAAADRLLLVTEQAPD